jgi:hypothetical protein
MVRHPSHGLRHGIFRGRRTGGAIGGQPRNGGTDADRFPQRRRGRRLAGRTLCALAVDPRSGQKRHRRCLAHSHASAR